MIQVEARGGSPEGILSDAQVQAEQGDGISSSLRTSFGGVPWEAWSEEDQAAMADGGLPLGHPEHPNV